MSNTYAIVENGLVVNVAIANEPMADNWILAGEAGIGWSYDGTSFIAPPEPTPTEEEVRAERNRLLTASDWTQVADAPVDQAAWAAYRQALRDLPQQAGFPHNVTWPEVPA